MQIKCETLTGWPKHRLPELEAKLRQLARTSAILRVGVTVDCEKRRSQYQALEGGKFTEMVVIYETGSAKNAYSVERQLIDRCDNLLDTSDVVGLGGGLAVTIGTMSTWCAAPRLLAAAPAVPSREA